MTFHQKKNYLQTKKNFNQHTRVLNKLLHKTQKVHSEVISRELMMCMNFSSGPLAPTKREHAPHSILPVRKELSI